MVTWKRPGPRLSAPLAIRLSRRSLPAILGIYLAIVAVWACLISIPLHLLATDGSSFGSSLRLALWAMWGPDNLLSRSDGSFIYYAIATVNAVVGVLLPVFVLGAFVFKLFHHDPLVWREKISVEAHPSGYYVLTARFYNHFQSAAADVRVRAWLRWNPVDNRTVYRKQET
jgi:hypothetical protein